MNLPSKEIVNQVRYLTSPLKFFIYLALITGGFALGFASLSKMDSEVTKEIVMALFYLFVGIISVSFVLIAWKPKKYLYTRKEWSEQDKFTDSNAEKTNKPISKVNVKAEKLELPNESNLENQ